MDGNFARLLAALWLTGATPYVSAEGDPTTRTVIGSNPFLVDGAAALQVGNFERGVRLTLLGLAQAPGRKDRAVGLANLCAGYIGLERLEEALKHCAASLELNPDNWHAYHNRALALGRLGRTGEALQAIESALALNPESRLLQRTQVILAREHRKPAISMEER